MPKYVESIRKSLNSKNVTKPSDFVIFVEICVQLLLKGGLIDEAKKTLDKMNLTLGDK